MSASVDELSCRFIGKNGKKYEIHANITVSYTHYFKLIYCKFIIFDDLCALKIIHSVYFYKTKQRQ